MNASYPQQAIWPQQRRRERPSPIADLIGKHKVLLGIVYDRHARELAEREMNDDHA